MDYKKGKIYQILNNVNDDIYIGSTYQALSKRLYEHKSYLNEGKGDLYKLMRDIGKEPFYIELIELYPCNNREELRAREGYYIRERGSLNKLIAGRTQKERNEENKEQIKSYRKQYHKDNQESMIVKLKKYYNDNKESIKQQQYEKIQCSICGGKICRHGLKRHQKTNKCKSFVKPDVNE